MKKGIFIAAFALLASFAFSQNIHKGSLVGVSAMTLDLKPDVAVEDFAKFYATRAIPQIEKAFPGSKLFLLKGVRGEKKNSLGTIWIFTNEAARNKFFNDDGTPTAFGKAADEKLKPLNQEMEQKFGRGVAGPGTYTDWHVQ